MDPFALSRMCPLEKKDGSSISPGLVAQAPPSSPVVDDTSETTLDLSETRQLTACAKIIGSGNERILDLIDILLPVLSTHRTNRRPRGSQRGSSFPPVSTSFLAVIIYSYTSPLDGHRWRKLTRRRYYHRTLATAASQPANSYGEGAVSSAHTRKGRETQWGVPKMTS